MDASSFRPSSRKPSRTWSIRTVNSDASSGLPWRKSSLGMTTLYHGFRLINRKARNCVLGVLRWSEIYVFFNGGVLLSINQAILFQLLAEFRHLLHVTSDIVSDTAG